MAIRLTEFRLRQIIREEVIRGKLDDPRRGSRPTAAPSSATQSSYPNLTVKRVQGYNVLDRPIMMRRAEITGEATQWNRSR